MKYVVSTLCRYSLLPTGNTSKSCFTQSKSNIDIYCKPLQALCFRDTTTQLPLFHMYLPMSIIMDLGHCVCMYIPWAVMLSLQPTSCFYSPCRLAKLDILLINTKVPRSSKKLIAAVREKHDKVWCTWVTCNSHINLFIYAMYVYNVCIYVLYGWLIFEGIIFAVWEA